MNREAENKTRQNRSSFQLTKIIKDNRSGGPSEQETESDLPTELLELIFSRLSLRDNICASAVCKSWLAVAISVRKANKPPWLMYFPKSGDLYEFYDPSQRKTYCLEFPELRESRICYAKDAWLLLFKPTTYDYFFFCPYTRELIKLPKLELMHQMVAFSAAPTSPNCVLFTVEHYVSPGAPQWSTINYDTNMPFFSSKWNKIVFCDGGFFCLSITGLLGVYILEESFWAVYTMPAPKCMRSLSFENHWRAKFMAEHNGEIYVVCTSAAVNPFVYKLDGTKAKWVEMESLGGLTFFANFLSSHARTDLLGRMRNYVVFSKVLFYGKRCVTYSPDDERYYPRKQLYDWDEQDPFESIWIEPPEDPSIFP
ncbi:hypothetical protein DH2020_039896 [Rehmannia glutinosa]|uniref:F-box domain-containing protein n=1 Tax=Rehmannia glutinosa TaxID=99300 RepID=A0ABR0UUF1_REHGL